ncbi:hypothetical protein Hanom_Chr09g00786441 [Helianthus anomalus]
MADSEYVERTSTTTYLLNDPELWNNGGTVERRHIDLDDGGAMASCCSSGCRRRICGRRICIERGCREREN